MVANTSLNLSLDEFLSLQEERWGELPEYPYEFQHGEFIKLQENLENSEIASTIMQALVHAGIDHRLIKLSSCQIEVSGGTRRPDLLLLAQRRKGRSLIRMDEPTPPLAVEVISPSSATTDREDKLQEYLARGIPEYWIIDPAHQTVTLNVLQGDRYEATDVTEPDDIIPSTVVPGLSLRVRDLFDD
ncbi:MAG: Uma2 family endonuclease [Leptolyngbyaceae bacterium]|nr:Uma2 family endonuclease [Leptolyngbyaceae bacterium]